MPIFLCIITKFYVPLHPIMNELAKHIEILLLDNDCVIVPGFGGFMAHHVCAEYSDEERRFIPPFRTIGFNPQLQINDSLLAQSFVEAYDISYPEALRRIEANVNELNQQLHNTGSFELEDIGTISINEDSNLIFEPCVSGILTPSYYALTAVDILPLELANMYDTQAKVTVSNGPIASQSIINTPDAEATCDTEISDEHSSTDHKTITINLSRVRQVAAVVLLLLAFTFSALPLNNGVQSSLEKCSIDTEMLMRTLPSMQTISTSTEEQPVQMETPAIDETIKTKEALEKSVADVQEVKEKQDKETTKPFVIVLASKVSRANAEVYISKVTEQGVTDARIIEPANGNKVVCGAYETEEDARKAASEMRSKDTSFAEVWVMEVNK